MRRALNAQVCPLDERRSALATLLALDPDLLSRLADALELRAARSARYVSEGRGDFIEHARDERACRLGAAQLRRALGDAEAK